MSASFFMLKMGLSFSIVMMIFMLYDLIAHTGIDRKDPSETFKLVFGGVIASTVLCLASSGILLVWDL